MPRLRRPWPKMLLQSPSKDGVVVVGTDVAVAGFLDGATTVVVVHKPRRPWKLKLLRPTLLNLSRGVVVAVDMDVADPGVMDGAATVVAVHKPRPWKPKLLMPTL